MLQNSFISGRLAFLLVVCFTFLLGKAQAATVNIGGNIYDLAGNPATYKLSIEINGTKAFSGVNFSNNYLFTGLNVNAGDVMMIYIDDDNSSNAANNPGVVVTCGTASDQLNIDIRQRYFTIRSDCGTAMTIQKMNQAMVVPDTPDADLPFATITDTVLNMRNASDTIFYVPAGQVFNPGGQFYNQDTNLSVANTSIIEGTVTVDPPGGLFRTDGHMAFWSTAVVNLNVGVTFQALGDMTTSGSGAVVNLGQGNFIDNGTGTFDMNGATLNMTGGLFRADANNFENFGTVNATGGTFQLNSSNDKTINTRGGTYYDFTWNPIGGAHNLTLTGSAMTVLRTMSILAGRVEVQGANLTVGGSGAGNITFCNNAFCELRVTGGSKVTTLNNVACDDDAILTIDSNSTFTAMANFSTQNGLGDGGDIVFTGDGTARLELRGNITALADTSSTMTGPGTVLYNRTAGNEQIENWNYYNLELQPTGRILTPASTTISVSNSLSLGSGTLNLNGQNLLLGSGATVTISGGVFMSANVSSSVSANSGAFAWNMTGGALNVDGLTFGGANMSGMNITGGTITKFDNVTWSGGAAGGAHATFDVDYGSPVTINNHTFDLSTTTTNFAANIVGSAIIVNGGVCNPGMTDCELSDNDSNNRISFGNVITLQGSCPAGTPFAALPLKYAVNQTVQGTGSCSSGTYSITPTANSGDTVYIWFDDNTGTDYETVVDVSNGANQTGLDFYDNRTTLYAAGGTITSTDMDNGLVSGEGNIPFGINATQVILNDGMGLYLPTGVTLSLAHDLWTGSNDPSPNISDVYGTITSNGNQTVQIRGDLNQYGTINMNGTSNFNCRNAGHTHNIYGAGVINVNSTGAIVESCTLTNLGQINYLYTVPNQIFLYMRNTNVNSLGNFTSTSGRVRFDTNIAKLIPAGTYFELQCLDGSCTQQGDVVIANGGQLLNTFNAGGTTWSTSGFNMTLQGTASVSNNGNANTIDVNGGSTWKEGSGAFANNGLFQLSDGTVEISGDFTNTQTVDLQQGTMVVTGNWSNGTAGDATTVQALAALTIEGNLTATGASTFSNNKSVEVKGTFNLTGATHNLNGTANLYLQGSVTSLGTTFTAGASSKVTYLGSQNPQTIGAGTYGFIAISKTAGTVAKLGGAVNLTNNLTLTTGTLDINGNTLAIGSGKSLDLTGGILKATLNGSTITQYLAGTYNFRVRSAAQLDITKLAVSFPTNGLRIESTAGASVIINLKNVTFSNTPAANAILIDRDITTGGAVNFTNLSFNDPDETNIRTTATQSNGILITTFYCATAGAASCETLDAEFAGDGDPPGKVTWTGTVNLSGANFAGGPSVNLFTLSGTILTGSGSPWNISVGPNQIAVGDPIIIATADGAAGNTSCIYTIYGGNPETDLDLAANRVTLRNDDDVDPITTTEIRNIRATTANADVAACSTNGAGAGQVNFVNGRTVYIPVGHEVDVTGNSQTGTLASGSSFDNQGTFNAGTVTFTQQGSGVNTGTIQINSGTFIVTTGTFNGTGGTIDFTGVGTAGIFRINTNTSNITSFGNLDSTAGTVQYTAPAGTHNLITDDYYRLFISTTASTYQATGPINANLIYVQVGVLDVNGQTVTVSGTGANVVWIDTTGTITVPTGTLSTTDAAANWTVTNDLLIGTGTVNATGNLWRADQATSTLTFSGAGVLNMSMVDNDTAATIPAQGMAQSFTPGTGSISFAYQGANTTLPNATFNNLTINTSSRTANINSLGDISVNGNFTLTSGVFDLNGRSLKLSNTSAASLNGGTFQSSNTAGSVDSVSTTGYSFTVNGANLNISGMTFKNAGMNGFNIQSVGTFVMNNVDFDHASPPAGSAAMTVGSGVAAALNLSNISFSAHTAGVDYNVKAPAGGGVVTINSGVGPGTGPSFEADPVGTTNPGRIQWGNIFNVSGVITGGSFPIALGVNGTKTQVVATGSPNFAFSISAITGSVLTIYYDNNAADGCLYTKFTGADMTGLNLRLNEMTVRNDYGAEITSTEINTGYISSDPTDMCTSVAASPGLSPSVLTTLRIETGQVLNMSGNLRVYNADPTNALRIEGQLKAGSQADVAGGVNIVAGGTFTGAATTATWNSYTGNVNVDGSLDKSASGAITTLGTFTLGATGNVNLGGTASLVFRDDTINNGGGLTEANTAFMDFDCRKATCQLMGGNFGQTYLRRVAGAANSTFVLNNDLAINSSGSPGFYLYHNINGQNVTLDMNGHNVDVTGNCFIADENTETSELKTSGGALTCSGNLNLRDNVAMTVGDGSLHVSGNLTESNNGQSGTLSINNGSAQIDGTSDMGDGAGGGTGVVTFTGNGTLNFNNATNTPAASFTKGTGTVSFTGTGNPIIPDWNYYNLTIDKTSGTATMGNIFGGNTTVTGVFSMPGTNGSTFDMNGRTLRLEGATANLTGGTFKAATLGSLITRNGQGRFAFNANGATLNLTNLTFGGANANGLAWSGGSLTGNTITTVTFNDSLTTNMKITTDPAAGTLFNYLSFSAATNITVPSGTCTSTPKIDVNNHSGAGAGSSNASDPDGCLNWGTAVTFSGTAPVGRVISVVLNDTLVGTDSDLDGNFAFTLSTAPGDAVVVFINDGTAANQGAIVMEDDGANKTGLLLEAQKIKIGGASGTMDLDTALMNLAYGTAVTNPSRANLPYNVNGTITQIEASQQFILMAGTTLHNLAGNIDFNTATDGALTVPATATLVLEDNRSVVSSDGTGFSTAPNCNIGGTIALNNTSVLTCNDMNVTGAGSLTWVATSIARIIGTNLSGWGSTVFSAGTVDYRLNGSQNIPGLSYANLTLSNGNAAGGCVNVKTLTGSVTVAGTLTINIDTCVVTNGFGLNTVDITMSNDNESRLRATAGSSVNITGNNVTLNNVAGAGLGKIQINSSSVTIQNDVTWAAGATIELEQNGVLVTVPTGMVFNNGQIIFTHDSGRWDIQGSISGGAACGTGTTGNIVPTAGGKVRYTGSSNQSIKQFCTGYSDLTVEAPSTATTMSLPTGGVTVNSDFALVGGTFDMNGQNLVINNGTSTLTGGIFQAASGTVKGSAIAWTVNGAAINVSGLHFQNGDANGFRWVSGTMNSFSNVQFSGGPGTGSYITIDGPGAAWSTAGLSFSSLTGTLRNVTSNNPSSNGGAVTMIAATCNGVTDPTTCEGFETESGAAINWTSTLTLSGTCDQNGSNIRLYSSAVPGVVANTTCAAGAFSFTGLTVAQVATGSTYDIYYTTGTNGVIVDVSNGSAISNFNLKQNTIALRSDGNGTGITNIQFQAGYYAADAAKLGFTFNGALDLTSVGGMTLVVASGHTYNPNNGDLITLAVSSSVVVETGATLVLANNSDITMTNGTFTLHGVLNINAANSLVTMTGSCTFWAATASTINVTAASTITLACTVPNLGSIIPATSTTGNITFNGTANQNVPALSFSSVSVTKTAGTLTLQGDWNLTNILTLNGAGSIVDTNGKNVTLSLVGGTPFQITAGTFRMTTGGTVSLTGAGAAMNMTSAATAILDIQGGTLDVIGNFTQGALALVSQSGGRFEIGGTPTMVAAGTTFTGGTFVIDGATPAVNLPGDTYYNFLVNKTTGSVTMQGTSSFNNVQISGGTLLTSAGNYTVTGNWDDTGGTFDPSQGTVIFSSNSGQTINQKTGNEFLNLTHTGTGTLTPQTNMAVEVALSFTGGTFDLNGKKLTIKNGGSFSIASGATFQSLISGGAITAPSGSYGFDIQSGGTLNVQALSISNTNTNGMWIKAGANVTAFNNTYHSAGNTKFIKLDLANYTATWDNHYFDSTNSNPLNIDAGSSTGSGTLTMTSPTGARAGEAFDVDGGVTVIWQANVDHFAVVPNLTSQVVSSSVALTITAQDIGNITVGTYANPANITLVAPAVPGGTCVFSGTGVTDNGNCTGTMSALAWSAGIATLNVSYTKTGESNMIVKIADQSIPSVFGQNDGSAPSGNSITWQPLNPLNFLIDTQHSGTEVANTPFSLTLTARDKFNNIVSFGPNNYNGSKTITFSSTATGTVSCSSATIPANQAVTFSAGVGVTTAAFNLVKVSESPTITATDLVASPNVASTSLALVVTPGAIGGYIFGASSPASPSAGGCFSLPLNAVDSCRNYALTDTSAANLSSNTGNVNFFNAACAMAQPGNQYTLAAGFATVYAKDNTSETTTVIATKNASTESGSTLVTIGPGAADALNKVCDDLGGNCYGDSVSANEAGGVIKVPVFVTDSFGNRVSGVSLTATVMSGGGSVSGSPATTDSAGFATLDWTTGGTAGANSLKVDCAACATTNSKTFNATTLASTQVTDLGTAGGTQAIGGATNLRAFSASDTMILSRLN